MSNLIKREELSFVRQLIALLAFFEFNKERDDLSFDSPIAVLLACLLSFDLIRLLCLLDSNLIKREDLSFDSPLAVLACFEFKIKREDLSFLLN